MTLGTAARRNMTKAQASSYTDAVEVIRDALKVLAPSQRPIAIKEGLTMAVSRDEAQAIAQTVESQLYMEGRKCG